MSNRPTPAAVAATIAAYQASRSPTISINHSALLSPFEDASQPFDFIVALDFEATCEADKSKQHPQEIIEVPAVILDTKTLKIVDTFRSYCRPVHGAPAGQSRTLSDFCTELTKIQQDTVDRAPLFLDVFTAMCEWLTKRGCDVETPWIDNKKKKKSVNNNNNNNNNNMSGGGGGTDGDDTLPAAATNGGKKGAKFCIVTDGRWDCEEMLPTQFRILGLDPLTYIPKPFINFINLKDVFSWAFPNNSLPSGVGGILSMAAFFKIEPSGQLHSGLDDSVNIARLIACLMRVGVSFDRPPPSARASALATAGAAGAGGATAINGQPVMFDEDEKIRASGGRVGHDFWCRSCQWSVYGSKTACSKCGFPNPRRNGSNTGATEAAAAAAATPTVCSPAALAPPPPMPGCVASSFSSNNNKSESLTDEQKLQRHPRYTPGNPRGDWYCRTCEDLIFGSKPRCMKCGSAKPNPSKE